MEEQPQQQPTPQPEKPKKKFYKKWWFWVLILLIILVVFLFVLEAKGEQYNCHGAMTINGVEQHCHGFFDSIIESMTGFTHLH